MRLLYFLSLLAATALAETPLETATITQRQLDSYIRTGYRTGVISMLLSDFVYQDCNGKKYGRDEFTNAAMITKVAGKVLEARADKLHIIYKVRYGASIKEFMITRKLVGWYFEKGQTLIC